MFFGFLFEHEGVSWRLWGRKGGEGKWRESKKVSETRLEYQDKDK